MLCLKDDETFVIKKVDKGGGIVIMNKEYYKRKFIDMLNDDTFYKKAHDSHSKNTFKKIKQLIQEARDTRITSKEIDYLLNFEYKASSQNTQKRNHQRKMSTKNRIHRNI